jgi:pSer/pThr/pTyr-binding forkhead associated (FHA) protein
LTDGFVIRKNHITCSECSREIEIPTTPAQTRIKCVCGTTYEYNPTIKVQPYLILEDQNKQTSEYPIAASVRIGREDQDYVTLTNQDDPSIKQNTYVRNIYVSRQHSKITVLEEFTFHKEGVQKIISKKKCILQDCGSTNGTSINLRLLKPHEEKELKQNDLVTLAPNSNSPLTFIFKEK